MKIEIDPKKELFKWGPIRYKMIYPSVFIEVILTRITEHYHWAWPPSLAILNNGALTWICDELTITTQGLKYFKKYFLNLINYQKHWQSWKDWIQEYQEYTKKFNQIKLKNLSNKELHQRLKYFYDLNIKFWLIVHVPEFANWGGEYLLKNKLKKLYPKKINEYLEILGAPVKFSFFQTEELDLLKIDLIKNKIEKEMAFKKHSEKYFWILNSYGGNQILKKDYFEKQLKELLRKKSSQTKIKEIKITITNNKARKRNLIKKLKLNKEMILITEQLSQSIWWQDLRKGYIWQLNSLWDKFLKEVARRTKWKFSELQWCWSYEPLDILKNRKVDKKKILNRKKYYAIYAKEGKLKEIYNTQTVKNLIKTYLEINVQGINEFKGLVVSKGKKSITKGLVKIINNPFKEINKVKKGNILVAGMTSPEYIIAMRKAAAIITDHGGMTAHAAIVSRELNIPCIVNTKIATKVLKDGDIVEVDADKGLIKIL